MLITRPFRLIVALALASLSLSASAAPKKPALPPREGGPIAQVTVLPSGSHLLGNPAAKIKLVEYMSYTCPHCAHFEDEAAPALKIKFVGSGKGSLEIRHYLRDQVDVTVALLVNCAPPQRFWSLHHAFLAKQETWMGEAQKTNAGQQARWNSGKFAERMRAIARDLRFYEFMDNHGVERTTVDRCLANEALARRLAAQTDEGTKLGIEGTPSFFIGDTLLAGTHDWKTLEPQLSARM